MTEKVKAKRKLTNFTFEGEDSAIALVGPAVGGPANSRTTLITKSLNKRSPEFIQKATSIQVTLSIPEFLEKFYGIWGSDQMVLASLMGYEAPEKEDDWSYEDWIEEKISSYKIIKSLNESNDITESLAALSDEEYLSLLTDQVTIEKALEEFAKEANAPKVDTSTPVEKVVEVKTSKSKNNKGKSMNEVELQKALDENKVALQKAQELIASFEAEKKASIAKAKSDKVKAVLKDEKQAAVLIKSVLALETDEEVDALVSLVKSLVEQAEQSDAFKELGASGDAKEVVEAEPLVTSLLKAQFAPKK